MPPKATKKSKGRKPRIGFTTAKDVILLKSALSLNPWQMGDNNWALVAEECNLKMDSPVTVRTVKTRIDRLIQKYKKEELLDKTGQEEQSTERGDLLKEIIGIVEEEKQSINVEVGAEDDGDIPLFTEAEVQEAIASTSCVPNKKKERIAADTERDLLLENSAPDPNSVRRKRQKLCIEDEMIKNKQEHDMEMEKLKFEMEKRRLDLEEKREARLCEEGRRRDEIAATHIEVQNKMLELMGELVKKQ